MIERGKRVAIEYSVFLADHTAVDSNVGQDPLVFNVGSQQVLPALESVLTGLNVGDTVQVTLQPEEAYGYVNPGAFKEVDITVVPEDLRFEGAFLMVEDEIFKNTLLRVKSLKGDRAIIDFNHPLAGKELTFDIRVLDVS